MLQTSIKAPGKHRLLTLIVGLGLATLIIFAFAAEINAEAESRVVEVYPKPDHTFVLTENGSLWAWGNNRYGKLGDGTTTNRSLPVQPIIENVAEIYPQSSGHTFALKEDGSLWGWERNWDGRLGAGTDESAYPTPVQILENVKEIFPHERHSFALTTDGKLWGWGRNNHGQVGDGTTNNRFKPVEIDLNNVEKIIPGDNNTFALLNDSTLWAWGNNRYGKLGDGTATNRTQPVQIMENVKAVYPQEKHTIAHRMDQTLWAWGYNWYGQLGNGNNENQYAPVQVNLDQVAEVYVEESHAYAVKDDGSLWAWGNNWYGQLGDGSISNRHRPIQISLENIAEIHPQRHHAFAVKEDGSLWGWGRNWDGRVGNNSSTHVQSSPEKIAENIDRAFIKDTHALALDNQSSPLSWGNNNSSPLGGAAGETNNPSTLELNNVQEIYPQENHAFALKNDGSLWAWGDNSRGRLGTGSNERLEIPAQVLLGEDLPAYNIAADTEPEEGGTVSGTGTYRHGESVALEITPESGYTFVNWTEAGEEVSTDKELSFLADRDRELIAHLEAPEEEAPEETTEKEEPDPETYSIELSVDPDEAGATQGEGEYGEGEEVTVAAEANEGYEFVNWTEIVEHVDFNDEEDSTAIEVEYSDEKEYTFTAERDRELIANFEAIEEDLTTYSLELEKEPEDGGTVSGAGEYEADEEVTITAEAAEGYQFSKWTEEAQTEEETDTSEEDKRETVSENKEHTFVIENDRALIANFEVEDEKPEAAVEAVYADNGAIEVTFDEELAEAPDTEGFEALHTSEALKPEEETGTETGDSETTEEGDDTAANFAYEYYNNDDENENPEEDNHTNSEENQDNNEEETGEDNEQWGSLTLTGIEWDEDTADKAVLTFNAFEPVEETVSYTIKLTYLDEEPVEAEPFIVEAELPSSYSLTLETKPEGGGTVSGAGEYKEGEEVTIIAEATEGYQFNKWTKGEKEASADAEFTYIMPGKDVDLTAHFEEEAELYEISLSAKPEVGGVVSGEGKYEEGETVTIKAEADEDYKFSKWAKDEETISESAEFAYTMLSEDVNLTAYFEAEPELYEVSLAAEPKEGGTVDGEGKYEAGKKVTVTAKPNDGYVFTGWTENTETQSLTEPIYHDEYYTENTEDDSHEETISEAKEFSFEIESNRNLTANFDAEEAEIQDAAVDPEELEYDLNKPRDVETAIAWNDAESIKNISGSEIENDDWAVEDNTLSIDAHFFESFTEGDTLEFTISFDAGEDADLTVNIIDTKDYSGFDLSAPGEVNEDEDFKLSINNATDSAGDDISGENNLTVASDSEETGEVFFGDILFEDGQSEADISLAETGEHELIVEVAGVTESETISVEVTPEIETAEVELRSIEGSGEINASFGDEDKTMGEVNDSFTVEVGTEVSFSAVPDESYEFANFGGEAADEEKEFDTTITIEEDYSIETVFTEIPEEHELALEIEPAEAGKVEGAGKYEKGEEIKLSAESAEGYTFAHWTEDEEKVSEDAALTYSMPGEDTKLTAHFEEETESYEVRLSAEPEDGGTVDGEGEYEEGETVQIVAEPEEDYEFSEWSMEDKELDEDLRTEKEVTLQPTGDEDLIANFIETEDSIEETEERDDTPEIYSVEVDANDDTGGSVSGEGVYEKGDNAVVIAEPKSGYSFFGWEESGENVSFDKEYSFTVTSDHKLTAIFEEKEQTATYYIALESESEGKGTVEGEGVYTEDETAIIRAIPEEGYKFIHWEENGDTVSEDAEYSFAVEADRKLTALFSEATSEEESENDSEEISSLENLENRQVGGDDLELPEIEENDNEPVIKHTVTLSVEPEKGGTASGEGEYIEGALVGLDAFPNDDYYFTGWVDDQDNYVSMARNYAFLIEEDRHLTATFDKLENGRGERGEKQRISLVPSPIEGGRVYGSGEYFEGETITIAALPNIDFEFASWTVNGEEVSDDIILTFEVERELKIEAIFEPITVENDETASTSTNPTYYQFLDNYLARHLIPEQYQHDDNRISSMPPMGGVPEE